MLKILICRVCLFMQGTNHDFIRKQSRTQKSVENFLMLISQPWAVAVFEGKLFMKTWCKQGVLQSSVSAPVVLPLPFKAQRWLYNLSPGLKHTGVIGGYGWYLEMHLFDCIVPSCRDKKRCEGQWSSGRVASGPANQFSELHFPGTACCPSVWVVDSDGPLRITPTALLTPLPPTRTPPFCPASHELYLEAQ